MKETIVQQCLDILKRDDIKNELKRFFSPVIDLFFIEINPYMYITLLESIVKFKKSEINISIINISSA